jgi:hypothetical protein
VGATVLIDEGRRAPANKGRRFPAELVSPEEARTLLRACSRGADPASATAR